MRIWIGLALCVLVSMPAQADTLRVGSRVLATGDSAARVIELLGEPAHRASGTVAEDAHARHASRGKTRKAGKRRTGEDGKAATGERWQYRRGSRTVTIVLVQGRVARIE